MRQYLQKNIIPIIIEAVFIIFVFFDVTYRKQNMTKVVAMG